MGMVYAEDMLALYRGKLSISCTPLDQLPDLPPIDKRRANILFTTLSVYILILASISIFLPYNQWIKMLLAIAAGIIILIMSRLFLKACLQKRNKSLNTKDS